MESYTLTPEEYQEYQTLKVKDNSNKTYLMNYYANKLSINKHYCECCNKHIKSSSWNNHLKSQKHLLKKL